jgi:ring-1,2-phenylacetyl-CoA epoxidase subunit PaaE
MTFHKITVKDIQKETADAVSVSFTIPENLQTAFQFSAGQYLNIKLAIDGKTHLRSYSICSSPTAQPLQIAVKCLKGGLCSTYINEVLQAGSQVELSEPMGKFKVIPNKEKSHQYTAFAAGSGITPILSMIKTILSAEPKSRFTLVYGNRNRKSIIFKETLEALKDTFMERFQIVHVLSRERTETQLNFGRIDQAKCQQLFQGILDLPNTDAFFLCGPEAMVQTVQQALEENDVDANKIHFELFTTEKKNTTNSTLIGQNQLTGPTSEVQVILDGIAFDFSLAAQGPSILEAAMAEGADLPFSCKSGVCCTCKARLIEGEVAMDVVYGLEPDEIDRGFILTCQSHPRSAKLVVDFDSK